MKKKLIILTISLAMLVTVMAGCASKAPEKVEETTTQPAVETGDTDAVSSASLALDEASFLEKISTDGNWIVLTTSDLTFTEDLIFDGGFDKRSLALASNNADGKLEEFSLTVPNLVINNENTLLEYGTVKGDVYVEAEGFTTKEATIEGNLYFATQELMDAFTADELTTVTGSVAVCEYTK